MAMGLNFDPALLCVLGWSLSFSLPTYNIGAYIIPYIATV